MGRRRDKAMGSGTADNIPARLSAGEFVVKASAARKIGEKKLETINKGRLPAKGKR